MLSKYRYILLLIFAMGIFAPESLSSQSFLSTNGKAIVNEQGDTIILRGMGLGGWMVQEGYMLQTAGFANSQHKIRNEVEQLIGSTDTDAFYDAWLANHCRKADIDSLAAWGFNSIRLPMHYNLFTLPIEDEPVPGQQTWLTTGFELTDSVISWCKQNQMYVILDLHAAPGGQGYDEGISDYDPNKPSLWESKDNRDKCVALWKRLAERYVNEPWVAAYDLINEPNWNLPGGTLLRAHYEEIMDSIRTVDNKHIIIIEGNWFANDFTGLTPPWDNNMVYGPHKYWSFNYKEDIQWVLTIRDQYNVPLYLGESGENSNVWFNDAISLLEENDIGWAWWPMKKIESIAGPLSVTKSPEYQSLLNYWNSNRSGTPPTAAFTKAALMDLTEKLKVENCYYQKDVIDAMFRQIQSDETTPYQVQNIPGRVYASDFDMGRVGAAYFDTDLATYQVSSGQYTAWNKGWAYRNDGVDMERSTDPNGNGFNIGWTDDGEWMKYTVNVDTTAVYDIDVRVASDGGGGNFRFSVNDVFVSKAKYVPNSGGWQAWQDLTLEDVVLKAGVQQLKFHIPEGGYNLSSFEFIQKGATTTIDTDYLYAQTRDNRTVELMLNKPISGPLTASRSDFTVLIEGLPVTTNHVILSPNNDRAIWLNIDHTISPDESIRVSYSGNQVQAQDGTSLQTFVRKTVQNTVPYIHAIPGKMEAEHFFFESGTDQENTFDTGGGKNIGNLDANDYMDYYIDVKQGGFFNVAYRTAGEMDEGDVRFWRFDTNGNKAVKHRVQFAPTGDFQTWATTNKTIFLPTGKHHVRVEVVKPGFNLNWLEFSSLTDIDAPKELTDFTVFPNPANGPVSLQASLPQRQNLDIQITNLMGQTVYREQTQSGPNFYKNLDLSRLSPGSYIIILRTEAGNLDSKKLLITRD